MDRIGVIGAGNMAYAIVQPIGGPIWLYDAMAAAYDKFASLDPVVCKTPQELVEQCETVFLCVKPQNIEEALESIKACDFTGKLIVSIVTGVSTGYITERLGQDAAVIRVMPNTPLLVGEGACALCCNCFATPSQMEWVCGVLGRMGMTRVIEESLMNDIVAVNGSSPAYIYYIADIVARFAENKGIDRTTALALFCQTLIGSARMMLTTGQSPQELIEKVCSPGGTTLRALETFQHEGLAAALEKGMENCVQRAEELGK